MLTGKPCISHLQSAPGTRTLSLRPPDGDEWELLTAVGYHDDIVDRDAYWVYTDTKQLDAPFILFTEDTAMGATDYLPLLQRGSNLATGPIQVLPLLLTHDVYLKFSLDAINPGAVVNIYASWLQRKQQ